MRLIDRMNAYLASLRSWVQSSVLKKENSRNNPLFKKTRIRAVKHYQNLFAKQKL